MLNRIGMGNALKWLKELDLEKYLGKVLGIWREVTHRLEMTFDSILTKFKGVLPPAMLDFLRKLKIKVQEVAQKGEEMIPDAVKELNERLKAAQRQLYQGEWHEIPKNLKSSTREVEARLVDVPGGEKWVVEKMPYPPNGKATFVKKEDWPDLTDRTEKKYFEVDAKTDVATYKTISCFSGPMRPVKIPAGKKIYRVIDDPRKAAGDWWVYELPKSGQEWREGAAVLDSWNGNGTFVEMVVPDEGLFAWEGKAASQVENSAKAVNTNGQFLQGGNIQLFIDLKFLANAEGLNHISTPLETHWTGHTMLHVPPKEAQAEYLNAFEYANKVRVRTTTVEKIGRSKKNDEN